MPDQVSGLAGYNCEVDGVQVNTDLIPEGAKYQVPGLDPLTDYSNRIVFIPVDNAGNPGNPIKPAAGTAVTTSPTPEQVPMSAADVAAVDAIVAASMKSSGAGGVTVGIVSPHGYLYKAYGSSGAGTMTTPMHMRMGSISKTFTATAIFREIDKGNLSLDDTVEQYVPGLPNGTTLTIRNLLMMQSGLIDDQTNSSLQTALVLSPTGAWSPDTTLAYIKSNAAGFTPGTAYQYTNSNFIVLGYVLKAITGRTPQDIITNDIITPLGLSQTSWPAGSTLPSPYSHGYWSNPLVTSIPILGPILFSNDITNMNPEFFDAAGALVTVVNDLTSWCKELRDGTLLSPEMQTERYTIPSTGPGVQLFVSPAGPVTYDYGMGFYQVGSWFGHDGSVPGFDSAAMVLPANGTVVAVMENKQTAGLAALASIWYEIAEYFYSGSTAYADYSPGATEPATLAATLPMLTAETDVFVYNPGDFQPYSELLTPASPTITDKPTPLGCNGCRVTPIGGGAAGDGFGNGGGGGAGIQGAWIPAAQLGPTYSASLGLGGTTAGADGGDSVFTSGAVSLIAGGGKSSTGLGGVASAAGVTPAMSNGGNGGASGAVAGGGTTGNAAGGGGGGANNPNGRGAPGGKGGDSTTVTGGAGGTATGSGATPADAAAGNGGAGGGGASNGYNHAGGVGGNGGKYGGGGGGGGEWYVAPSAHYTAPGLGGDGYLLIEWE